MGAAVQCSQRANYSVYEWRFSNELWYDNSTEKCVYSRISE